MIKTQEIKRVVRFALFGAVGFGIGGLIAGAFHLLGRDEFFSVSVFMMPIWGGLGAASLALAPRSNRTAVLAVLGGAAPIFGIMMAAFIGIIASDISIWLIYIVALITTSVAAGVPFGIIIWGRSNWEKIIGLIFTGAFAFGIGQSIIFLWYGDDSIVGVSTQGPDVVGFIVFGIIGGVILGIVLGFLQSDEDELKLALRVEKERESQKAKQHEVQIFEHDTGKCPYCNSSNIDEGYTYSWERRCLDCKAKWIVKKNR